MSVSALETVRAAFKVDLEAIVAGATYRNTVKAVCEDMSLEATEFPTLTLLFLPDMTVEPIDDTYSCYKLHVPFAIFCEVRADTATSTTSTLLAAQDSLIQDILHCVALNYSANLRSTPRWNIQGAPNLKVTPVYPSGDNKGLFSILGTIHIHSLDNTFA